jgi:hypothetical protein
MAYEELRDYIKIKLEAIPSVGQVQDYYRYLKGRKNIQAELYVNGLLDVWFIQKAGEKNAWEGPGSLLKTHIIDLIGAHGIDDANASEKTFLLTVQAVLAAFQADYTWGGLIFQTTPPVLQKQTSQGAFVNMYCHNAVIRLQPIERISL